MQSQPNGKHGGKREGSGRKAVDPELKSKSRTVTLNDSDYEIFKEMGGSKWLSQILRWHKASNPSKFNNEEK